MTQEHAEKVLAFIESQCKAKVEKVIKETLGVDTAISFTMTKGYGGFYINGIDTLPNVQQQMTATPLLQQLFKKVTLEISVGEDETLVAFNVSVKYEHAYEPGSNGRDLMKLFILKNAGEVIISK